MHAIKSGVYQQLFLLGGDSFSILKGLSLQQSTWNWAIVHRFTGLSYGEANLNADKP